jgi:hypothetical protein
MLVGQTNLGFDSLPAEVSMASPLLLLFLGQIFRGSGSTFMLCCLVAYQESGWQTKLCLSEFDTLPRKSDVEVS